MAEGQADRGVVWTLKVVEDPGASAALEAFARKTAEATAATATVERRAGEEKERARESAARKDAERREREVREAVRAEERKADAGKRAHEQLEAANRKFSDSSRQALEGVVLLGRGLATMGLVGEKDVEQIVRGLVKIKAVSDSLQGVIYMWRGMADAVHAYRGAVTAAAAVQVGAGAAGAGGAAAGAAGGAAAGAGGATAIGGVLAALTSLPGAVALAIAGVFAGGTMLLSSSARQRAAGMIDPYVQPEGMLGRFFGSGGAIGRFSDWLAGRPSGDVRGGYLESSERVDRISTAEADRRRLEEDSRARAADEASTAAAIRASEFGMATRGMNAAGKYDMAKAGIGTADGEERFLAIAQERLTAEKEITQEKLRAADQAITKAQTELDLRQKAIDVERQRLTSAEERFGQLSTQEQQRLIGLQQRAERGENLTVEEWQALQRVGTRSTTERAGEAFRKRAEAAGFRGTFGGGEETEIGRLERERGAFEATIRDQRELKVTLERDDKALADRITAEINSLMDVRDARLIEKVRADFTAREEARNRAQEGRNNAARGAMR